MYKGFTEFSALVYSNWLQVCASFVSIDFDNKLVWDVSEETQD